MDSLNHENQANIMEAFSPIFWSHLDNTSLCIDYPVEKCKISVILFGSMLPNLKGH